MSFARSRFVALIPGICPQTSHDRPQMLKQVSEYKTQMKVIKEQEADMKTQVEPWRAPPLLEA